MVQSILLSLLVMGFAALPALAQDGAAAGADSRETMTVTGTLTGGKDLAVVGDCCQE